MFLRLAFLWLAFRRWPEHELTKMLHRALEQTQPKPVTEHVRGHELRAVAEQVVNDHFNQFAEAIAKTS